MPITTTRTSRIATARELADTVVTGEKPVLSATAEGFELVDQYGVTYTGTPSHLALVALARPDLTTELYSDDPTLQDAIRRAASRIGLWFTCEYVHPDHAAAFAALTPSRVCELVAHLVNHRRDDVLSQVGPASLSCYTAYLISDAVKDPEIDFPTVIDRPHLSLVPVGADRFGLDIVATAPDDADQVSVRMSITAREVIRWQFVAAVPVPTTELNTLLMTSDWALSDWIVDNTPLIDDHLDYSMSYGDEDIDFEARLASPTARLTYPGLAQPAKPPSRADFALYFVGLDRETAITQSPFLDHAKATTVADALGHQIFVATADVSSSDLSQA